MSTLQNALLSAIPFLANWLFSIFYSRALDFLVGKKIIKTVHARKTSMAIGKLVIEFKSVFFLSDQSLENIVYETILRHTGVKVIIKKSGDINEKYLRFGLVLGRLAMLKKNWADYEQLLRVFFSCFQGQKKCQNFFKNIVASALKSCCIK